MKKSLLFLSILLSVFITKSQDFHSLYPDATHYFFNESSEDFASVITHLNTEGKPVNLTLKSLNDTITLSSLFGEPITIEVPILFIGNSNNQSSDLIIDCQDHQIEFKNAYSESYKVKFISYSDNEHIVTNKNDNGTGSLRAAILANNVLSMDIHFNIPSEAPHTISLETELPYIKASSFNVSGLYQPNNGYTGSDRKIVLDGSLLISESNGFIIDTDIYVSISGIKFQHFNIGINLSNCRPNIYNNTFISCQEDGISSSRSTELSVFNNIFGTSINEELDHPNGTGLSTYKDSIIHISQNVFSNNNNSGIHMVSNKEGKTLINDNLLGTNINGTKQLGEQSRGIYSYGYYPITIENNTISGNDIGIFNVNVQARIFSNKIGVNTTTTDTIPNEIGILTQSSITIGNIKKEPNIICGNTIGIQLSTTQLDAPIYIQHNLIGLNSSSLPLPNNTGILINNSSIENTFINENRISSNLYGIRGIGSGGENINIENNTFGLNKEGEYGVNLENGTSIIINGINWKIKSNLIGTSKNDAIQVATNTSDYTIENNIIENTGGSGIYINCTNTGIITNNKIETSSRFGIEVNENEIESYIYLDASKNLFSDNEFGGISDFWTELKPQILNSSSQSVSGTALPKSIIEVYYNLTNQDIAPTQGDKYIGTTLTDENGNWELNHLIDSPDLVIAIAIDTLSKKTRTSAFSNKPETVTSIIPENLNDLINIYPNPAQNIIHITNLQSNEMEITIVDQQGNIVKDLLVENINNSINIEALTPGLYFLQANYNEEVFTKKIIKE